MKNDLIDHESADTFYMTSKQREIFYDSMNSSAKKQGRLHLAIGIIAVILYGAAFPFIASVLNDDLWPLVVIPPMLFAFIGLDGIILIISGDSLLYRLSFRIYPQEKRGLHLRRRLDKILQKGRDKYPDAGLVPLKEVPADDLKYLSSACLSKIERALIVSFSVTLAVCIVLLVIGATRLEEDGLAFFLIGLFGTVFSLFSIIFFPLMISFIYKPSPQRVLKEEIRQSVIKGSDPEQGYLIRKKREEAKKEARAIEKEKKKRK